jgi:hypothetical protein
MLGLGAFVLSILLAIFLTLVVAVLFLVQP